MASATPSPASATTVRPPPALTLPTPPLRPLRLLLAGVQLVACCDDGFAENDGKSAAEVGAEFKATYAEHFPDLRFYDNHKDMCAPSLPAGLVVG